LNTLLDVPQPVLAGILYLGRTHSNGMINICRGFQVFINLPKIVKAVAN
jgi:hypothetical protein